MKYKFYLPLLMVIAITLLIWKFSILSKFFLHQKINPDFLIERNEDADELMTDFRGAAEYEYNMIKDPKGRIPVGIREKELQQAADIFQRQSALRITANSYAFLGPGNLGGRTRAIVYDAGYNG